MQLWGQISSKCQEGDLDICGVIDQVDHGETEYEVKTGTGSSFRRHFGKKAGILQAQYPRCYGCYEDDIGGRNLRLGIKYSWKISRS